MKRIFSEDVMEFLNFLHDKLKVDINIVMSPLLDSEKVAIGIDDEIGRNGMKLLMNYCLENNIQLIFDEKLYAIFNEGFVKVKEK